MDGDKDRMSNIGCGETDCGRAGVVVVAVAGILVGESCIELTSRLGSTLAKSKPGRKGPSGSFQRTVSQLLIILMRLTRALIFSTEEQCTYRIQTMWASDRIELFASFTGWRSVRRIVSGSADGTRHQDANQISHATCFELLPVSFGSCRRLSGILKGL